jgi:hypothetical protein
VLRGLPGSELVGSFDFNHVDDVEIRELRLQSRTSHCVQIHDSHSVRVRGSDIGPCAGNGVMVLRSQDILVTDNYIHPEHHVTRCCDTGDGLYAREVRDLRIAGNVVAFGEANLELQRVTGGEVVGNYLLNPAGPFPRGQQVQVYDGSSQIAIEGNSMEANRDPDIPFPERQEDAVNAGQSSDISVSGNFIAGGGSPSGCGIIADEAAHRMSILDNILWQTGQCGIGIASGTDHRIIGNKIRNSFVNHPGAGNTAIYVWRQYAGDCGPVRVSGNVAYAQKPNGEPSSFWKGSASCDPVTIVQNVFGEPARRALNEDLIESMRPPIPPQPQGCVAPSPFSNHTGRPPCLREAGAPQEPPVPIRARTRTRERP